MLSPVPRGGLPALKTEGALHDRVARLSGRLGWLAAVVTFGWLTWIHVGLGVGFVPNRIEALALVAVVGAALFAESRAEGWAFAAAATAIGSVVGSIFFELFPRVMVSSTNSAYNLTVANSASPSLHTEGDDGGGGRLLPGGPRLPGVEPLRVPEADQLRAAFHGTADDGAAQVTRHSGGGTGADVRGGRSSGRTS